MKGMGNDLIREARKRRGLTQAQLAELAGTTQSAIARLEAAKTAPSFDDVIRYLRLMDLDLDFMLVERDDSDWLLAAPLIDVTPDELLERHEKIAAGFRELRRAADAAA
ncbi:helix-turn-helix transcriptional regulator [Humibacter soli]